MTTVHPAAEELGVEFPSHAFAALDHVLDQGEALQRAAELIADCIAGGGVLHTYGTGHSRSVAQELSARAGGLVPVSMLSVKDVVMFGDVAPEVILDPTYERIPGLARQVWDLAPIDPRDAFLVISNSGVNAAIVELARLAKDGGHPLIAITSFTHTRSVPAPHGDKLVDLADVAIDNGAPLGDATVRLAEGVTMGGVSTLAGVFTAQILAEKCCRLLLERGHEVPVFHSANVPGSDEHNARITAAYAHRVRPVEP